MTVADEDGDPVVFNPSSIPNETKLFLGVNGASYQAELVKAIVREDDWAKWER